MESLNKGVYYLFFKDSRNPKRCHLGVKYPGIEATPLVMLGGKRAKELYGFIIQLLENNGISYTTFEMDEKTFVELPLATGLATSIFLLAAYSCRRPLRYAPALERMILGRMPLMKYLTNMVDLALELNYLEEEGFHTRQTLSRKVANSASKILIQLIKAISK
ncbi:MAG: hypothetical protein QXH67_00135 [Candidatus Bathyarchaeia archaeon]